MAISGIDSTSSTQTAFSGHPISGAQVAAQAQQTLTAAAVVEPASSQKAKTASEDKKSQENNQEALQNAVERTQAFVSSSVKDIQFTIDQRFNQMVVKVMDRETKEVIREIPSEEMLELAKALEKLQGLLVREKA